MAACADWFFSLHQHTRIQVMGLVAFGWTLICLTSIVTYMVFPDRSSLPSLLLAMVFGSWTILAIFRMLISDRCKRRQEDVQDHIWASMSFEAVEMPMKPKFHHVEIRISETSKGKRAKTSILEEVAVVCPAHCKQHTCVCCLEDFKRSDQVSYLPCGHIFHESCHVDWHVLKKSGNGCPICRDSWAIV